MSWSSAATWRRSASGWSTRWASRGSKSRCRDPAGRRSGWPTSWPSSWRRSRTTSRPGRKSRRRSSGWGDRGRPVALAKRGRAIDPAQTMRDAGFEPDCWQESLLRSTADRILLLCSRQLGKSTSTAILALNEACYRDDSLVLLVSRSERQSDLLFQKVARFYRQLRPVPAVKELALSIKLANGSEIVALPGDGGTIRGYSDPRLVGADR